MKSFILSTVFALCATSLWAQHDSYKYTQKLNSATPAANYLFGSSVDLSGNRMVVGAPGENAVYFFANSGSNWSQSQRITSAISGNNPGLSVAINGDDLAYSSYQALSTSPAVSGAVTVLQYTAGLYTGGRTFTTKNNAANDSFGFRIAMDRNLMVVTAVGYDTLGKTNCGVAYVYEKINGVWRNRGTLAPTDLLDKNRFGYSVSVRNGVIAIGAPGGSSNGAVYVFRKINGDWVQTQKINQAQSQVRGVGLSVAVNEEKLILTTSTSVSSEKGRMYWYEFDGNNYVYKTALVNALLDSFQSSSFLHMNVCISENRVYVSNSGNKSGAGNIYEAVRNESFIITTQRFRGQSNLGKFGLAGNWKVRGDDAVFGSPNEIASSLNNAGNVYFYKGVTLNASDKSSDAWVDLSWRMNPGCAITANQVYLALNDVTNNKEIYHEIIDSIFKLDELIGSYRHLRKPASISKYEIRLYEYGNGTPFCTAPSDTGSTKAFVLPVVSAPYKLLNQNIINWSSSSDYTEKFKIYRNGTFLAFADRNTNTYTDKINPLSESAAQNGVVYNYCMQAVNNTNNDTALRQCVKLGTYDVSFTATDERNLDPQIAKRNSVLLAWADLADYATSVTLLRDGKTLGIFNTGTTNYTDANPVPGKAHVYTLVIESENTEMLRLTDTGSIKANGSIAGWITHKDSTCGVPDVLVTATAKVDGVDVKYTTRTDARGYYQFNNLYYGTASVFSLSALRKNVNFDPSAGKTTLEQQFPNGKVSFIATMTLNTLSSPAFTVSGFNTSRETTADRVKLSWNYNSTDTVYFALIRNGALQNISFAKGNGSATWYDTTGLPGYNYEYTLVGYRLKGTKYAKQQFTKFDSFPRLFPVPTFAATPVSSLGVTSLNWQHSSSNFENYEVYRNSTLIATLPASITHFDDKGGRNNVSYKYSLITIRHDESGNRFTSAPVFATATYPALKPVAAVSTDTVKSDLSAYSLGYIPVHYKLKWTYNPATDYNFSGYIIKRHEFNLSGAETVGELLRVGKAYKTEYTDKTCIPGYSYSYEIMVYKEDSFSVSTSVSSVKNKQFAIAPTPVLTSYAAPSFEGFITLIWVNMGIASDGYMVMQGTDTVGFFDRNTNNTNFVLPTGYAIKSYPFKHFNYRIVNGVKYYSTAVNTSATPPTYATAKLTNITNFTATQNKKGQVALSWSYPDYIVPTWVIFRDGAFLDSFNGTVKNYYDFSVTPGQIYSYQIQAQIGTNKSNKAYASGKSNGDYFANGTVRTKNGKVGIYGVGVTLLRQHYGDGTDVYYSKSATTDSAGYFSIPFSLIPGDESTARTFVTVSYPNGDFAGNDTIELYTNSQTREYRADFYENSINTGGADTLAAPVKLSISSNAVMQRTEIRWSVINEHFSGFKVFRGLKEIADVKAGENMEYYDTEGEPDYDYSYRVKAYYISEGITTESKFVGGIGRFPTLYSVESLSAALLKDYVKLQWSHLSDLHSYYEIKKNHVVIGVVNTGGLLQFIDSATSPGQLCVYEVTAVLINSVGKFRSVAASVSVTFPSVSMPQSLAAVSGNNRVALTWKSASQFPVRFDIYRDGTFIGSVKGNGVGNYSFNDYAGKPLYTHEYAVGAICIRNGNEYSSRRVSVYSTFPALDAPSAFTATPIAGQDKVTISLTYTNKGADFYRLYRSYSGNPVKIAEITSHHNGISAETITFQDITGSPGATYVYQAEAVSNRFGKEFTSARINQTNGASVVFPTLSAPFNFTASTDNSNYVALQWEHKSTAISRFRIYRDGKLIDSVPGNQRHYVDLNNTIGKCNSFSVTAVLIIGTGQGLPTGVFASAAASASGATLFQNNQKTLYPCESKVSSLNGYMGVDFDGTRAAFGSEFDNRVYIYNFNSSNNTWNRLQSIDGPSGSNYGFSVAISGDILVVGAPQYSSNAGATYIYKYNGTSYQYLTSLAGGANYQWGYSVDIYQSSSNIYYIAMGAPGYGSYQGAAMLIQLNSSTGSYTTLSYYSGLASTAGQMGYSVAVSSTQWAAGIPFLNSNKGSIFQQSYSGTTAGGYKFIDGLSNGSYFGMSVDMVDNEMYVGAPMGDVGLGTTYYCANSNVSSPVLKEFWQNGIANAAYANYFGQKVKISGSNLVVGSPYHQNGSISYGGAVYVLNKSNGALLATLSPKSLQYGSYMGFGIAANGNNILASAPLASILYGDDGIIYHFQNNGGTWSENAYSTELTSVTASDGAYANQCLVQWTFTGNKSDLQEFQILRDDILIGTADAGKDKYFDKEGVPGKKHVYTVIALYNSKQTSEPKSDLGYRLGNGEISGQAVTYQTGDGVPGVVVTATSTIDGDIYTYKDTTDANGNYKFENIYYGSRATYYLRPFFSGHQWEKDTISTELKENTTQAFLQPFRDLTAFLLSGTVKRKDVTCGLDSIRLRLKIYTKNGVSEKQTYTDADGKYAFVLDPFNLQVLKYVLVIDRKQYKQNSSDYKYYQWSIDSLTIVRTSITANIVQDITDNLQYNVKLSTESSCGVLGTLKFTYNIKSSDGCYEQNLVSADNGVLNVTLPPLDYKITVSDVLPLNSNTIPIVDYLKVRPRELDLASMHQDSLMMQKEAGKSINLKLPFIYHKQPKIILDGIARHLCNDPASPAIWNQGSDTTVDIRVVEVFNGVECPVNEGSLVIRNTGSNPADTVVYREYNKAIGGFDQYGFKVGEPAIIAPYQKYLIVEYHTQSDGFLGETIQPMIVYGVRQQPGNDVLVKNDGDGFQLPLMILRDPPGDESQSWIEKGSSFTRHFTMRDQNNGSFGMAGSTTFAFFGIGANIEASFKGGGGTGRTAEMEVTYSTRQKISTSSNSGIDNAFNTDYLVGDQADVIVGAGLALTIGIADEIYPMSGCKMGRRTLVTVAPNNVKTTWVYTVTQIERIIADYDSLLHSANITAAVTYNNDTGAVAKAKIQAIIDNWKNVLDYHRRASAPFLQLCDKNNYSYLPEPFRSNAKDWVDQGFCKEVGEYVTIGNGATKKTLFVMKNRDQIKWTDELFTKYKKVNQFVRSLSDTTFQANFPAGRAYTESRLNSINIDNEYAVQYGADAENITFAGQTSVEKEVSVQKSQSRAYSQNTFFEAELYAGIVIQNELEMSTGGGLGAIFLATPSKVVDAESTLGASVGYNFEFEQEVVNTQESSQTVGYLLQDNDAGDQFSVNILRGVDPSHTPYFWTVGGRSSCPNEPYTIPRDQASLTLESADGRGFNTVQQDIPVDSVVAFPVKMANLAPAYFNESRYFSLSLVQNSNKYGAIVESQGIRLGEAEYRMPPTEPIYTYAYVSKGSQFYDYDDIVLTMTPTCPDNSISNYQSNDLLVEVHFRHECSNVSIVEPGDNWVIKKAGTPTANESLVVYISDYDLSNTKLQSITLQYRLVGSSDGWRDYKTISKAQLSAYFWENRATYREVKYPFVWDIKNNESIIDGDYEIRAMSTCGTSGFIFSNVIHGKVDRSSIVLFGNPLPNDGLLSLGDEISVSFNKYIQCARIKAGDNYNFVLKRNGAPVHVAHSCFGNKLIFTILDSIPLLDGEIIQASVKDIQDLSGNKLGSPVVWEFVVSYNPIYWNPAKLSINLYRNTRDTVQLHLLNTSVGTHSFTLSSKNRPWSSPFAISNNVPPAGQQVDLRLNATGMALGVYYDTLRASVNGFTTEILPVEMHVLASPPNWNLSGSQFDNTSTIICNFDLDSSGTLSSDTMDRIAAFIGSELRGVSNITRNGNFYRALITVQGSSADNGRPIDFRVWDASRGVEYDGHPRVSMTFGVNKVDGTTASPRILDVSILRDSARYIRLTKGWNHLAFNTTMADMSVDKVLRNLSSAEGDLIKTQDKTANYSASLKQWVSLSGGIKTISNSEGYLLFISHNDSLRVSGTPATGELTVLNNGWTLVGNVTQGDKPVNVAYSFSNLSNSAIMKNFSQSFSYDSASKSWSGPAAVQTNSSYWVRNAKFGTITPRANTADTNCSTFTITKYDKIMSIFGVVWINGVEMANSTDKVRAIINGECRGTGTLEYNAALKRYVLNLMVYNTTEGDKITFRIIRNDGSMLEMPRSLNFQSGEVWGTPDHPFVFTNGSEGLNTKPMTRISKAVAYPVPFSTELHVDLTVARNQKIQMELIDNLGRILSTSTLQAKEGENSFVVDASRAVMPGVYYLRLLSGKDQTVLRVLKTN